MKNYSKFQVNIFCNNRVLENVKVFARRRRRQCYDNTSTFSSKTAELTRLSHTVAVQTVDDQNYFSFPECIELCPFYDPEQPIGARVIWFEESLKLDLVIYRPKTDYLNIGLISGTDLLEMKAHVCVCVCVFGRGIFFMCICGSVYCFGMWGCLGTKGSALNFTDMFLHKSQFSTHAYHNDNTLSKGKIHMDTDNCFMILVSLSDLSIEIINQREAH